MNMQRRFTGTDIDLGRTDRAMWRAEVAQAERERLREAAVRTGGDSPWIALFVWSGHERSVENHLRTFDIESLVPMRKGPKLRRHHRVLPAKDQPVLVGYVLVRCRLAPDALKPLRAIEQVRGLVGGTEKPHRISHDEVMRFNALAGQGAYDWELENRPRVIFRKDEKVLIDAGPFKSFPGTVLTCRPDGKGDAVVEVQVFGRSTPVLMPLALLSKV